MPAITITLRFYAELNDFLPYRMRQRPHEYAVDHGPAPVPYADRLSGFRRGKASEPGERSDRGGRSCKDVIEALGVPHTEVDLILVNGEPVDFAYTPRDGDRVSVYPVFESLDISGLQRVRSTPLREPRFVLDVHLGRLAAYLRLLGLDTLYANDYDDPTLARISHDERRILLTRDRDLLKRAAVTHGYYVRETDPRRQLAEVVRRFDLAGAASRGHMPPGQEAAGVLSFARCLRCNGELVPVAKETVDDRLPERVRAGQEAFWRCVSCGQVYWQGTHHERMRRLIAELELAQPPQGPSEEPGPERTEAGEASG